MKLKETIYNSIKKMNADELTLLYEQIKLLESIKSASYQKATSISIEKIHEMTNSSKSCWSNTVIEDRVERV